MYAARMISPTPAKDLISELNETDETEHLEAKASTGGSVSKTVYETICALSNEPGLEGGTILLGVEKEEALFPLYNPVGVDDPDKPRPFDDIGWARHSHDH
jgi:ATP-dependent DNA helicase RecG